MQETSLNIAARLAQVRDTIAEAADGAGVPPGALVAVSKTHPAAVIEQVITAGQRIFGENKVQEAAEKWPGLRAAYPDIELHLIGPLQSNKVRQALELFDVIQSVDRAKIARRIAEIGAEIGKQPRLFVQVNTGEEPQKAGVPPTEVADFLTVCRDEFGLTIEGLMCIPPSDDEPALHFALLKKLAQDNGLAGISMGMSGDYELAAQMGATHLRVGSAIFGPRNTA